MNGQKIQVKVFFHPESATPPLQSFIPLFHAWIAEHALPELLIDVANYAHVPEGPGVVLIGHASDYAVDEQRGRRGLLFSRKRLPPPVDVRLSDSFRRTIHAAHLLEQQLAAGPGTLRFASDEWLVRVNDRLAAPNTESTLDAFLPEVQGFCRELFREDACEVERQGESRQLFGIRIRNGGKADLLTLLSRLGGSPDMRSSGNAMDTA